MILVLLTAAALAAAPAVAGQPPVPAVPAVALSVPPAAAPKPAMKYQLLPEVRELKPGNAAQWYLRCFAEQRNFFFTREAIAQRARYQTMPLKDLPQKELTGYGGSALSQADWGARLDTIDWQVLERVQSEGTEFVMPELRPFRELAGGLRARFRGEVARHDFDAAIGTAKTMFAFARHLGEAPAPAANALGLTVADMTLDTIEELIQEPGSPNLYWALTDLPSPLVDVRKGFQGSRALADAELRGLLTDRAMTDAELDELLGQLSGRVGYARQQAGLAPRNLRGQIGPRVKDSGAVLTTRGRLVENGTPLFFAARIPALQAILLDEKREFELRRDNQLKLLRLSPSEADTLASREAKENADAIFADLVPQVAETRRVQARLEQRIALLRCVEALRMYAATHAGKLPAKPGDVDVPLPSDPFTGKPFAFELSGATVRLHSESPKDDRNATFTRRYEVTVRGK